MASVFFSYSHKDEELRNELEIHLALLKRQGIISFWHDRRITAGTDINSAIAIELEEAQVILLLISAHFLASNYCYEKEMERALERHQKKSAIVIPVILHPCDWQSAPFGSLRATPTDGKPISMFGNIHEAFSIVTKDIREALTNLPTSTQSKNKSNNSTTAPSIDQYPRTSNLAIKKEFSDHERDEYLEDSYEYIARFFAGSISELEKRNPQVQGRFKRIDETSFTASIYINGQKESVCSIWFGSNSIMGRQGICYSSGEGGRNNSTNEIISLTDDGYSLKLAPMGMQSFGIDRDKVLSQQGTAEHLWDLLIKNLQ